MYTKLPESEPGFVGRELETLIDALPGGSLYCRAAYQEGEITDRFVSAHTQRMSKLYLFVSRVDGRGHWFIENWEHDNGFRATAREVSAAEARALINIK